jgi:hypothetical protein
VAYGANITEPIVTTIGNPVNNQTYQSTGVAYDISIAGQPFFLLNDDNNPYRRVTAQYRKQQLDTTREPGEQTLTGWWVRSQSSFHLGAGIKYFEPAQDESLRFQFTSSKGVDVFTKGQITLLNATASAYAGAAPAQMIGLNDGTDNCIFVTDGSALKKITTGGTTTTITQAGTPSTILSLTTDGDNYYFINGTEIHRGSVGATPADSVIYTAGAVTRATLRYVKQRLIVAIGNVLYELNANATGAAALPTALYTHPNANWVWSSISEGPQAIYVSGYDTTGTSSSVFKITSNATTPNALGFPTLTTPTVIIDMPTGEQVNFLDTYLGTYAVLCTSKGVRVGVADGNGDISYGPLLFSDAACFNVAFRDSYAYVATKIDGESGLVKIDLAAPTIPGSLVYPWAWDLTAAGTSVSSNQVAFYGTTDRAAFSSGNNIYAEDESVKVPSGYLRTGFIRYNTLENKIFKYVTPRFDTADGGLSITSIAPTGAEFNIGSFAQGTTIGDVGIPYPPGAQQYLGFQFNITRSTTDSSKGPLFTGYQIKVLAAVPRQRLIQFPTSCYDSESDKFGNKAGYDGYAYDRLKELEAIESNGDTLVITDFRTNEQFTGIIEEIDFINKTPTDKRYSGYGGMLLVTVRSIS